MVLKRRKISNILERKIVSAAIFDDGFFSNFMQIYQPGFFSDEKYDLIIRWIESYQEKYDQVPGYAIQDIFLEKVESENISEEQAELFGRLFKKIEVEREKGFDEKYLLDKARELFQKKAIFNLTEVLRQSSVEDALEQIERFSVPKTEQTYISPFKDVHLFTEAIERKTRPLFHVKGALGEMMNLYFIRDSFIGFLAPEKRGKTWWLFHLALKAFQCKNNVALFCVGDMSEDQTLRRLGQMLTESSVYEHEVGSEILVPVLDCKKNQDGSCSMVGRKNKVMLFNEVDMKPEYEDRPKNYKPCTYCLDKNLSFPKDTWFVSKKIKKGLSGSLVDKAVSKFLRRSSGKEFRISTYPNSTVKVSEIHSLLKIWKKEDFIPDVVIIDYADILAAEDGREFRHQENEKWKALRKLSQEWNICLITATQADSASYDAKSLSLRNFSEDKRKFAHTTAFFSINETREERKDKVQRIGTLLLREGDFDVNKQVRVLQCRALGRVHLDSFWEYVFD
jgi:hypothetical protein